jgi:hypothetical protein
MAQYHEQRERYILNIGLTNAQENFGCNVLLTQRSPSYVTHQAQTFTGSDFGNKAHSPFQQPDYQVHPIGAYWCLCLAGTHIRPSLLLLYSRGSRLICTWSI